MSSVQNTYVVSLSLEHCKEMLRVASVEAINALAGVITQDQYEYATKILPTKKAEQLRLARTIVQLPTTSATLSNGSLRLGQ